MKASLASATLSAVFALSGMAGAQDTVPDMIIDSATQEMFKGIPVHVCPGGYAMAGAQLERNIFKCVRVFPSKDPETVLDRGSQGNFGIGTMHVCPPGWYMRGMHAGKDWLICSNGVELSPPFLDGGGATQFDFGAGTMHQCHTIPGTAASIMVGIHIGRDDFACAGIPH